jgi:ADP-heptose:LPS heptosyltransferase
MKTSQQAASAGGETSRLNPLRRLHLRLWRAMGRASPGGPGRKFSAVILKLDRIGDFVLAVSAIRLVAGHFGEENCALVISPWVAALARREFPRMTLIVLPAFVRHKRAWPAWWRARAVLAGVECDHLVCLRHQRWDYDDLVLAWIRADRVHALEDPRALPWVVNRRTAGAAAEVYHERPAGPGLCRELELHRAIVGRVLGKEPEAAELLPVLGQRPGAVRGDYVVVMPFSSARIKDLPDALLRELGTRPAVWSGRKVILAGSADQRGRLERCAAEMSAAGGTEFVAIMPPELTDLVDLIEGAAWVLTADTAAAHIAAALDRPAVILLGGGMFGQFGPWQRSARQRWLSHAVPCYQCGWHCRQPEPWCLTRITPGEVAVAIGEVTA